MAVAFGAVVVVAATPVSVVSVVSDGSCQSACEDDAFDGDQSALTASIHLATQVACVEKGGVVGGRRSHRRGAEAAGEPMVAVSGGRVCVIDLPDWLTRSDTSPEGSVPERLQATHVSAGSSDEHAGDV